MLSIVSIATPSRIAIRINAQQKADVKEEPPAKRRLRLGKLWWWMVAAIASAIGWQMWELHLYNAAVREAKEAGFLWSCRDTLSLIKQDWRNALKKETWDEHDSALNMAGRKVPDLERYSEILHRLRPTELSAEGCRNLDTLQDLTSLQLLFLYECTELKDLDALKGLTELQVLGLKDCPALNNVDGLKGLAKLQAFNLIHCPSLQNVDGLSGLAGLKMLKLFDCTALQNVDVLKSFTSLKRLYLDGCHEIPAAALRELRAALPNTDITFPDGSKNPP